MFKRHLFEGPKTPGRGRPRPRRGRWTFSSNTASLQAGALHERFGPFPGEVGVECSRLTGSGPSGLALACGMMVHRRSNRINALSCWFPEGLRDPRSSVGSNPPSRAKRGGLVLTFWLFSSSVLHEVIRTRVTPGCCGFQQSLLRSLQAFVP